MRAHEWTRARQRPVRRIGGALDKVAEEGLQEAVSEPLPARVELPPEAEPDAEAPEPSPSQELWLVEEAEPADEVDEAEGGDAFSEGDLPEAGEALREEPTAAAPPVLIAAEMAPTALARPERAPSARRPRGAPPRQAQLPLQLEPVSAEARRSATETREDLIQRLLDPHLSLQETAKLLNVCPTTVRRYTNRGLLAHYRTPGNQRRFRLSDVLAFMERQGIPAHGLERRRPPVVQDGHYEGEEPS